MTRQVRPEIVADLLGVDLRQPATPEEVITIATATPDELTAAKHLHTAEAERLLEQAAALGTALELLAPYYSPGATLADGLAAADAVTRKVARRLLAIAYPADFPDVENVD